jgi:hypothetical protein
MLLLIDIFSINRIRGYENPSLDIIVIELFSTGGCPLEEAHEHFSQNQSVISVFILISFQCYCGDYSGYIVVILPFLAFYLYSAYFLYLVYYTNKHGKVRCTVWLRSACILRCTYLSLLCDHVYAPVSTGARALVQKSYTKISIRHNTFMWVRLDETHLQQPLFSLLLDLISRWNSFSTYPRS